MSTFEDEIRRTMTGHDDEAPRAEDLLRSLEQARPRRRLAGWYGPLAAAAAVVAVVAGSLLGVRLLSHQPPPAAAALTCPARYARHAPWVPAKPTGVDGRSRLVPQQTPSSAVICAYVGNNYTRQQAGWPLAGRRTLAGNLAGLAAQLSWQARLVPEGYWCGGAGGPQTNYLIGLTYPGGGTIWVTASEEPGMCITDSNGEFTSTGVISPQVSKAFASGRWPARSPAACDGLGDGRLGQEKAMVPAGALSLTICTQKAHRTITVGYQGLIRALNRLPTRASSGSCSESPGSGGTSYQLLFSYAEGPAVSLYVNSGCHPAIDNGGLQSASASTVLPIIQQLLKAK